jgi:hypothetical protein
MINVSSIETQEKKAQDLNWRRAGKEVRLSFGFTFSMSPDNSNNLDF